MPAASSGKSALDFIKKSGAKIVDFKFVDIPGMWQHSSVPADVVDESTFVSGVGFDGSSIRGFQEIQESDMVLLPQPESARVDSFCNIPTVSLICNVFDPREQQLYGKDPRNIATRAEGYLQDSGIADVAYFGPELEFYIFDHISFDIQPYMMGYAIDSEEAHWNAGDHETPNLGYSLRPKEGYYPVQPSDKHMDIRSEMMLSLIDWGVPVEMHHHEVATAGQTELDIRYDTLLQQADNVMIYKYVTRNVARRHGKTVTFMPKPLFGDNGSGMHVHQSLWKGGKNLFYAADGYAELSQLAHYYIGGLLTHIDALMAFCAPTTNSYKRLVPHFEAPVNIAFSKGNRSAAIRIPVFFFGPKFSKSKRIEFRPPDSAANPYLCFAALLMAGLDGIRKKIDPVKAGFGPLDKNIYDLPEREAKRIKSVPGSLEASLDALEKDNAFLLEGDVFTRELIDTWLQYKRIKEVQEVKIRPHPYEFYLYHDL
ncbi:MAG: type I glutamate--ammonia ligase [Candidatus Eremiobacter antarcticus]|nr:type I glutamate--ammonia ligase [Candidatus Eremiobacteraeota bacterium]MBC5807353.1 type I glutamate--ammonia ligase [Candidatus Eremiobacteraeota bacterium]PZR63106.1 MAG: type I glutamate--ammonia ligase [Candidatus Eremiobacter sp. RRmetagenome_bin22]